MDVCIVAKPAIQVNINHMKLRIRKPSFKKKLAARTSLKRVVRHTLGFKAPRGWGWLTDPQKAAYNRAYNRTSVGCLWATFLLAGISMMLVAFVWILV